MFLNQTEEHDMQVPENHIYTSRRGVPVTVRRIPVPDSPGGAEQLEVRYGKSGRPGTVVWLPDVPRCWRTVHQIIAWFRDDRDNYGKPFVERSRRGPLTDTTSRNRPTGREDIPQHQAGGLVRL